MATMTFGQLDSWNNDGDAKRSSKEDYFNIRKDGTYNVRFVDRPYKFQAHWIEPIPGGKKLKVNCAGRDCSVCKGGIVGGVKMEPSKPKNYFVSFILNRDAKRFQVFEYSRAIFEKIKNYYASKNWGDPVNYDVEITRNLSKGPAEAYSCIAQPKEPLTAEELAALAEFKARIDLSKHTAPMTNEDLDRRVAEFIQRSTLPGAAPAAVVAATAAKPAAETDTDFDFT